MNPRLGLFLGTLLILSLGPGGCGWPPPKGGLLVNGELAGDGVPPRGWDASPGTRTEQVGGFRSPDRGLVISLAPGMTKEATAVISQTLDATPLRGRRIRLRAEGRLEPSAGTPGGAGRYFLRVDRPDGKDGFFDNFQGREIRGEAWSQATLIGDVATDAIRIALGAFLEGPGGFRVRHLQLEDLGPSPPETLEPPRPLVICGRENLRALARSLGYVRYFHPSDAAAQADWNRLAVQGIRNVESAITPATLARALQVTLGPVAPTVRFLVPGEAEATPAPPPGAVQVVGWCHRGLGQEPQDVYQRVRRSRPSTRPLEPLRLELGRGVSLSLPTEVFADAEGRTLPRLEPSKMEPRSALPEPTVFLGSAEDRAARLAAVCVAWAGPQHFHPGLARGGTDWNAALTEALGQAAMDPDGPALARTLRRMNARLHDGHGRILPPWQPDQVPAVSVVLLQGRPFVRATGQGIQELVPGSELLQVDGIPVRQALANLRGEISAPGETWLRTRLAREMLGGRPGSLVRIRFRRPGGPVGEEILLRSHSPQEVRSFGLPSPVAEIRPGIWYLDLERIDEETFQTWVADHGQCKAAVLDFRGYPAISSAFLGHFLEKAVPGLPVAIPVVTLPDRRGWTWDGTSRARLEPRQPRVTARVVGLVDGGTASYPESCLATLKAYHLATLVGERSAGVNGNLATVPLPCGFTETFAGMRVYTYQGVPFDDVGVAPDLPAPRTPRGIRTGRDEPLDRALALLSH